MEELAAQRAAIEKQLADPSVYADGGARASELGKQQAQLGTELEQAEAELLALYEADAA